MLDLLCITAAGTVNHNVYGIAKRMCEVCSNSYAENVNYSLRSRRHEYCYFNVKVPASFALLCFIL